MATKNSEYDFVVIGGGTAGPVVASRLTENANTSVILLEAGVNAIQDPRVAVPAGWSAILGTDLDWDFLTTPQEHMNGRQIGEPQGRLLGGGSALNAEVFVPPSAAGFDGWELLGNKGWNWDSMAPYFRKFHTLNKPDEKLKEHVDINWINDKVTGTNGPVQASFTDAAENPLGRAWVKSFDALGAPLTADPFSGRSTGAFSCPASVDPATKTRSYAATAYYLPASERSNLELVTGATVTKIVIDGASLIATDVVVQINGAEHRIKARKEVILAAGVFQSPKILELSGVGDANVLNEAGIECKVDNANIGEGLQDHLMTGVSFEVNDGIMTGDCLLRQEPSMVEAFTKMYQEHKAGPLAGGSLTSYAFMPIMTDALEKLDPGSSAALEKAIRELKPGSDYSASTFIQKVLSDRSEATGALFAIPAQVNLHNGPKQIGMTTNPVPGNYLSLGAALMHPLSRGSTHIMSSDPHAPPKIDPRFLSHPIDIEVFARHLMFVEAVARSEPMAQFLKPNGRRAQPGPNGAKVDTVDKAKEYIRETALSDNHPVGTCAMLPKDKGGVVDSELKVYGVDKLRVIDSSIMPIIPRANTQTTVYAIAEKAADIIKNAYGL